MTLVLLVVVAATGCKAKPVFPPIDPPLVWPQPPEPARIQYVGSLLTDQDLKPRQSIGQSLGQLVFGKKEARSMLSPYALCTDMGGPAGGRLFVCDSNAQLVHVFNFETRRYQQWRPTMPGRVGGFSQPVGIAIDPRGRVLVSDSVAGVIFVFDAEGKQIGEFGAGVLQRPCGIACDSQRERVCIADSGLHQVIILDLEGHLIQSIGERGVALGQFNYPTNIALDREGNLYISDTLNFRVQVLDPAGKPLRQIGRQGDMPGYFSQPKGIALDSENHVYIVDAHFESVQIFDSSGQLLLTFGEEGSLEGGQFWLPAGIHIDSNDRIWIADTYNRRVQVFDYLPETKR